MTLASRITTQYETAQDEYFRLKAVLRSCYTALEIAKVNRKLKTLIIELQTLESLIPTNKLHATHDHSEQEQTVSEVTKSYLQDGSKKVA